MRVGSILIALIYCQTGSYASDFNYSKAAFLTVKDGAKSDPFIAESPDPMHTYRCSGRELDMPVGTPDIMPTLLGLSGIKVRNAARHCRSARFSGNILAVVRYIRMDGNSSPMEDPRHGDSII